MVIISVMDAEAVGEMYRGELHRQLCMPAVWCDVDSGTEHTQLLICLLFQLILSILLGAVVERNWVEVVMPGRRKMEV